MGKTLPAKVEGPVFNVLDYGAVPNDDKDDIDAIQRAVDAAGYNGGGVVFIPPGVYDFDLNYPKPNPVVRIWSSNVVVRGAGSDPATGTVLRDHKYNDLVDWTTVRASNFFIFSSVDMLTANELWYPSSPWDSTPPITTLSPAPQHATVLTVADASALKIGETYVITQADPDMSLVRTLSPGHNSFGERPSATGTDYKALKYKQIVTIVAISGNQITVDNPLTLQLETRWSPTLWATEHRVLREVGVEDMYLWMDIKQPFVHHEGAPTDYGNVHLRFDWVENGWARNIVSEGATSAVIMRDTKNCVIHDCKVVGGVGHSGYEQGGTGSRNLYLRINGHRQFHTFTIGGGVGNVYKDCTSEDPSALDLHGNVFGQHNLVENLVGAIGAGGGSAKQVPPNHGVGFTAWNWQMGNISPYTQALSDICVDVTAYKAYNAPGFVVAGVRSIDGHPIYYTDLSGQKQTADVDAPWGYAERLNNGPVYPLSLYEAQRALRLDQAWCELLTPAPNVVHALNSSVVIKAAGAAAPGRSIAKAEFFADGQLLGSVTQPTPEDTQPSAYAQSLYRFVWNPSTYGKKEVLVKLTDDLGAVVSSASVPVIVGQPVKFEDDNSAIRYNGPIGISTVGNGGTTFSGGTARWVGGSSSADLTFRGTRASVWTSGYGKAAIYLDDMLIPVKIWNQSGTVGANFLVWDSGPLPEGEHTVRVTATGNYGIDLDHISIVKTGEVANLPPSVRFASPDPVNQPIFYPGTTATFVVDAKDADGSVTKVEFFDGSTKLGEDSTPADGFRFTYSALPSGTHEILALATDNQGKTQYAPPYSLVVENQPPQIAITSPANNAYSRPGSDLLISVNAYDPDENPANPGQSVAKVEFFNGTTKLGEDSTKPYAFTWPAVPGGQYTLVARATDSDGAVVTSTPVTVNVANRPPAVELSGLVPDAALPLGQPVALSASATDGDGDITRVRFYAGAQLLGEDTAAPYQLDWTPNLAGTFPLTAVATDNDGADTVSAAVNQTFLPAAGLRVPETPAALTPGVRYEYYTPPPPWDHTLNSWNSTADFAALTPAYTGIHTSLTNLATLPDGNIWRLVTYGWRLTGYIQITTPGLYTFYTTSDDGSRLFIGGQEIVNNDGVHGATERSGTIALRAGYHAITVLYFQSKAGSGSLRTAYQGPGVPKQDVPTSVLFTSDAPPAIQLSINTAYITLLNGETRQFSALLTDSFGKSLLDQPTLTWSISGGGSISDSGLFTASTGVGGAFTLTATGGGYSGSATVFVNLPPLITAPEPGSALIAGINATVTAEVKGSIYPASAKLFDNGRLVALGQSLGSAQWSFTYVPLYHGPRELSVVFYDALGFALTQAARSVSVVPNPGPAGSILAYLGAGSTAELTDAHALSDGTVLFAGSADNLNWTNAPVVTLGNLGPIPQGNTGKTAFLLRASADLQTVLGVWTLPAGQVWNIRWIKTTSVPGAATGVLYVSGSCDRASGRYFIGRLDNNFVHGAPTGFVWTRVARTTNTYGDNAPDADPAAGDQGLYLSLQPWDVGGDGRVFFADETGSGTTGQLRVFAASAADGSLLKLPGLRGSHWPVGVTSYDDTTRIAATGTASAAAAATVSAISFPADLVSWTNDDRLAILPDGNGSIKRGRWPLDLFTPVQDKDGKPMPATPVAGVNYYGYTGYRNMGKYRLGAIAVDRLSGDFYLGFNIQSRFWDAQGVKEQPDFEPAVIAYSADGAQKWWSRLYSEVLDDNDNNQIDAGETRLSLPDQYVDGLAMDYSDDAQRRLVVAARQHGNDASSLWSANKIDAVRDDNGDIVSSGFQNSFTGTEGNIHITWIGKLKSDDGQLLAATYLAGYFRSGIILDQARYPEPIHDNWPSHNAAWKNLTSTTIEPGAVRVDAAGRVYVVGVGPRLVTTSNAHQKLPKITSESPFYEGICPWNSFVRVFASDLKTLVYSTAVAGRWTYPSLNGEPVGADNTRLRGVFPVDNGVLAVGFQMADANKAALGNPVPVNKAPAWTVSTPQGQTALLGRFTFAGAQNSAPSITSPGNLVCFADSAVGPVNFTVADAESAPGNLIVAASSDNPALLPVSGILLGGSGGSREITLAPAAGQTGSATVTLTVSDGDKTAQTTFILAVQTGSNPSPLVALTSPADLSAYPSAATITLAANASDANGAVARVDFLVDNVKVGQSVAPPYQINWKPSSPGVRVLRARAVDDLNTSSLSAPVTITVNPNKPPTIATPANGSSSTVTTNSVALSVLGADDNGEAALAYAWSVVGNAPAPVTFSPNASNAAKNTAATFTQPGNYTLRATVVDADGLLAISDFPVSVVSTVASLTVSPPAATVAMTETQTFSASAFDQFGTPRAVTWSVNGGGSINATTGLFTAGAKSGTFTATATADLAAATSQITIPSGAVLTPTADTYVAGAPLAAVNYGAESLLRITQPGAALVADYRFDGNLKSSVPGAPDLVYPAPAMAKASVATALDWSAGGVATGPANTGFQLDVSSLLAGKGGNYTVVVRARLPDTSGWRGLVYGSPATRNNDNGFQVAGGKLAFWNQQNYTVSGNYTLAADSWFQAGYSVSPSTQDAARINLVCAIRTAAGFSAGTSFPNIASDYVAKLNPADMRLVFFRDYYTDTVPFTVDRIQIYAGALSAAELLALDLANPAAARTESEALLKFDLSTLASVTGAKLRLTLPVVGTDTTSHTLALYGTAADWTETGVLWSSKPAAGTFLTAFAAANNSGATVDVDVTDYLQSLATSGTSQAAFSLVHPASEKPSPVFLSAREAGAAAPILIVRGALAPNFADWIGQYPSLQGASAQPAADPDGDGLPNLAEYALGSDPSKADAPSFAPVVTRQSGPGGDSLALTYSRASSNTGIAMVVEASSTLAPGSWTPVPDIFVSSQDGRELRRAFIPITGPRQFLRLTITSPP